MGATIAHGEIKTLDTSAALKMKGVLGVYSHGKIGQMFRSAPPEGMGSRMDEARPPFEDQVIRYYGQYIAVVAAETFEIAQAAANSIKAIYSSEKPSIDLDLKAEDLKKQDSQRGDAKAAFEKAPVKVEQNYVTPTEVHNPIELHSTVAHWEGEKVTLYETSQAVSNHQNVMAQMLGLPHENVRVISQFLGSGFWRKTMAVDAQSNGRRYRQRAEATGQACGGSHANVHQCRASPAHSTAHAHQCGFQRSSAVP